MMTVMYVDDFNNKHITVVHSLDEFNFLNERFYGQVYIIREEIFYETNKQSVYSR